MTTGLPEQTNVFPQQVGWIFYTSSGRKSGAFFAILYILWLQKTQIFFNQFTPLGYTVAAAQRVRRGVESEIQQLVDGGGGHMEPGIAGGVVDVKGPRSCRFLGFFVYSKNGRML